MADQGVDPRKLKLDWEKVKEAQRDKAVHESKPRSCSAKSATVNRSGRRATRWTPKSKAARQQRKPVAAVHMDFEKDGTLGRIASISKPTRRSTSCSNGREKTAES